MTLDGKRFVIPRHLVPDGSFAKLYQQVGISREIRRRYEGGEKPLSVALVSPHMRAIRFWLKAWPQALGRRTRTWDGLPSPDVIWLRNFFPGFESSDFKPESVLADFPALASLDDRILTIYPNWGRPDRKVDMRAFGAWLKAKSELARWQSLDTRARESLVECLAALDGISCSSMFSDFAATNAPQTADYFVSFPLTDFVEGPIRSAADEGSHDNPHSQGELAEPPEWSDLVRQLASTLMEATDAPPSSDLIDRLRGDADRLSAWLANHNAAKVEFARLRARVDDLFQHIEKVARDYGVDWLQSARLKSLNDYWSQRLAHSELERRSASENEFSAFAGEVRDVLSGLSTEAGAKRSLDSELVSLGSGPKPGAPPSEKKAAIKVKAQIEARRSECEQRIAEFEESLDRLLPQADDDPVRPEESPVRQDGDTQEVVAVVAGGTGARTPIKPTDRREVLPVPSPEAPEAQATKPEPAPLVSVPGRQPGTEDGPNPDDTAHAVHGIEKPDQSTNQPAFDDRTGELCRPVWEAIRSDQHALAFQLANALATIHPGLKVPPLPLLRALALAGSVVSRHGEVADGLRDSYSEIVRDEFTDGPQDWRTALNFLLIAATLKPCLIAPNSGATGVIEYAHPNGALHQLRQVVVDAGNALQGLNVSRSSFIQVRDKADWDARRVALDCDIVEWQSKARTGTINFQAATEVWLRLQAPNGKLGRLAAVLRTFDAQQVNNVRSEVTELEDPQAFRRLVNDVDRKELKRTRGEEIHARAFQQLKDRAVEVLALAERWIQLMQQSPQSDAYLPAKLRKLLGEVRRLQPNVEAEFGELDGCDDRWGLIAAGASAVRFAIRDFLSLETSPLADTIETTSQEALGRCLLWAPPIRLDDDWSPIQAPAAILEAATPLATGSPDPRSVLDKHLEADDIKGAWRLLATPAFVSHSHADALALRVEDAAKVARARLGQAVEKARTALEGALASGHLTEQERGPLDATLVQINESLSVMDQFGPAADSVRKVHEQIAAYQQQRIEEAREHIEKLLLEPGSDTARRMDTALQSGDLFVVYEYLQLLQAGESLPAKDLPPRDAFRDFFPEGAKRAEFALKEADKPNTLIEAIRNGRSAAGLDFSSVASAQRDSASQLARHWFTLKRSPPEAATEAQIAAILAAIGFASPSAHKPSHARRAGEFDVRAEPIADRSICPVPYFGSQARGHYRVICISGRPVDEDIPRMIGDTTTRATIGFYFGRLTEAQRRELARVSRADRHTFLLIDDVLMLHLCAERGSRLSAFFAAALPFTSTEPYGATSGLVPPEMFFGRKDEIKALTSPNGGCFVYGGRQLGKTALLRAAERLFNHPEQGRHATWIDLKHEGLGLARGVSEIWPVLHRELHRLGGSFEKLEMPKANRRGAVDSFLQQLRTLFDAGKRSRLLLLLDEADAFLEQDSGSSFEETMRLKNLMEATGRNVKVVFAGLHNVLRVTEQANHPLAHLGDPIEVGPLTKPGESLEALNMIVGPLRAAGYELASPELATRVLAQTNYYPVLIQLYGEELVRLLNDTHGRRPDPSTGPRYTVTGAIIDETYRKKSLRDAIRLRLQYTLQLDSRYEVIAYALAYAAIDRNDLGTGASDPAEIKRWVTEWWREGFGGTSEHEFRILLDEMVGLGVLRHDGPREYGMRNPNVLRLLGTSDDIQEVLYKTREPPPAFTPSVFHPPLFGSLARDPRRSPLSFTQESQLIGPTNAVSLIAGLEAVGASLLKDALKAANIELTWAEGVMDISALRKSMTRLADGRAEGTSLLVVPPDVPWTTTWVETALDKVKSLKSKERHLRIVFVADPKTLFGVMGDLPRLQRTGLELMSLRPWADSFVQRWLDDLQIVGNSTERKRLQQASGFWPCLLTKVPPNCHHVNQLTDSIEARLASAAELDHLRRYFGIEEPPARNVLSLVRDLPGEPVDVLEGLSGSVDLSGLAPEILGERIAWAEALQLVQPHELGWQADPIVARLLS